jgi:hypothetical protein
MNNLLNICATAALSLLIAAPARAQFTSVVVTSDPEGKVVNSWCEANGQRWGEHGPLCHSAPADRRPPECIYAVGCSVPHGWEGVAMQGGKPFIGPR